MIAIDDDDFVLILPDNEYVKEVIKDLNLEIIIIVEDSPPINDDNFD